MTDLLAGIARFILRLLLIVAGVVFVASLLLAFFFVFLVWALRAIWSALLGKPVAPIRMRVDPRAGFGRVYRAGQGWGRPRNAGEGAGAGTSGPGPAGPRRELGDVTDVEPKPPADRAG